MFFVFFSIDLIFLDKDNKVIEIKRNFRPWTIYFPKTKFSYLVEVKAGTVDKKKIYFDDTIEF